MSIGWIKLHRSLLEWEWYDDVPVRLTFLHLLITANWEDEPFQGRMIKRGQCITGTLETPRKIGVSKQQFRTAIKKLKLTGEITTESTNKNTLVTLVKYEDYQKNEDQPTTNPTTKATSKKHEKNTSPTTSKEVKKKRKEEENKLRNTLLSEINISDVEADYENYFKIAKAFQQLFIKNLEEKNAPTKNQRDAKYGTYVDSIRLMFEKDEITKEQMNKVYKYLEGPEGEFWKPNILSAVKLREKFQVLIAKANQPKQTYNGNTERSFGTNR